MFAKNKIVVTGAAGFLGGRTAKFLAAFNEEYDVIATSRRTTKKDELEQAGCTFIKGDLLDKDFCGQLTKNTSIIVHCAALSAPWGNYADFYQANFVATQNLLDAAIKNGVKSFIYISTPSIYCNYSDRINVSEHEPLPARMVNHYAATKLITERHVLDQNNKGIATIALRPRAIIGAEDTVIFPRVLEAYRKNKLRIIGNGRNVCDLTCARNVIEAILCCINSPASAYGEAYNITDGDTIGFWTALNFVLAELQMKPPTKRVSQGVAMFAARILEWRSILLNSAEEPALTRYGVGVLSHNFTLNITKAREQLNYNPVQKTMDGLKEFTEWYKKNN